MGRAPWMHSRQHARRRIAPRTCERPPNTGSERRTPQAHRAATRQGVTHPGGIATPVLVREPQRPAYFQVLGELMAIDMNKLLEICLQQNASDIHISVGRPPSFRISGSVKSLNVPALTPDDTAQLMK